MKIVYSLFLLLSFSLFSNKNSAQTTFKNSFAVNKLANADNEAFYQKSIEAADMESYRLKDKRTTLVFENGFEVEMFSAKELFVKGEAINPNSYKESFAPKYELPIFNILDTGHLTARVSNKGSKFK